jgi:formamidopyrimidine-DNA glycosylase
MPELPDLTVFAESLASAVTDKKITDAHYHRKTRLNVTPEVLRETLKSRKITRVKRVAKGLMFELDSDDRLFVHLMLSGGFEMSQKPEEVSYPVMTVTFADGQSLVLFDPRGLATVSLNPKLGGGAIDALDITQHQLEDMFGKKSNVTIKELLIDQSLIAGIGNAYSDEILWYAKISPKSIVGKIPKKAAGDLVAAIHQVLKEATGYLRKNHPGMMSGEVRDHLAVHKPKAKHSPTGSPILTEQIATKKTYYTEEQVLYQ